MNDMAGNIFQSVVSAKKRYNNFNLGREVLCSGQIGKLIPVQCDEVVPGDIFKQNAAFLMRFAPLSAPAMARFNVHFHTFFVPYRIITPETGRESTYERFIKSIGKHSEDVPVLPYIHGNNWLPRTEGADFYPFSVIGGLADYLGFPILNQEAFIDDDVRLSAMPFLTYQRIYQDFYRRDQIEQEAVFPSNLGAIQIDDGNLLEDPLSNNETEYGVLEDNQRKATYEDLFKLQTRNYERDYFTSALPEPQFGDEVQLGDGSVNWIVNNDVPVFSDTRLQVQTSYPEGSSLIVGLGSGSPDVAVKNGTNSSIPAFTITPSYNEYNSFGEILTSNMNVNPITVNEFRLAMQLQGIKEKINRVGTRYLEIMEGIYGVRVPDARLQRPIYLGGFKSPLTIGSVMQTSQTTETSKQGTLTGQMSGSASGNLVHGGYMFVEHGYLMTIMSVTPRTSYFGGLPRKYMKRYPEEFYLQDFDHLGEQPIYNLELYVNPNNVVGGTSPFDKETGVEGNTQNGIFGYTPRYAELKSSYSTVHGEFRTTLENWHVSRDFDSTPALNTSFIKAEPEDFDRIFNFQNVENTSNEHFYCQIYLDVVAKRNMSKYSTPYTLW